MLDAVDEMLTNREETFQTIRKKLLRAQERMRKAADANRREVNYQTRDWVMLKLRPYRQVSAKGPQAAMGKLTKRFYGPFQILDRIGKAAYRLKLLEGTRIHSVFHCSLLKPFKGNPEQGSEVALPKCFTQHQPVISPMAILDYRRA